MNCKNSCFTLTLFLVLLLSWSSSTAQSRGYIVQNDSVYTDGYIKYDPRKPFQVEYQKFKKSPLETYAAGAVTEFGYSDSTRFVAREVIYFGEKRTAFLKELAGGDLSLYMIRGENGNQYYFETNTLIWLTKENLQANLQQHAASSSSWQRQTPRIKLSGQPLRYYTRNINKGRNPRMSMFSFGAIAGFNRSSLRMAADAFPENGFGDFTMTSDNAEAGAFVEAPVWDINNLSIISQLSYGKMAFATTLTSTPLDQHMKLNLDFLRLSILPRYYLNSNRASLYVEAGSDLYYTAEQATQFIEAKHENTTTHINEYSDVFQVNKISIGINAGVGLQFFYLPKHYINLGVNTSRVVGDAYSINNLSTVIRINI